MPGNELQLGLRKILDHDKTLIIQKEQFEESKLRQISQNNILELFYDK